MTVVKESPSWTPYRTKGKKLQIDRYLVGLVVLFVGLSFVSVYAAFQAAQLAPAPYKASLVPANNTFSVCPGDKISQNLTLTFLTPAKLRIDMTVENQSGAYEVQQRSGESWIVHAGSELSYLADMTRNLDWTVPNLGPGMYFRTIGITTEGETTKPTIISTAFEITKNCGGQ